MYEWRVKFLWKNRMAIKALQEAQNMQLASWRWEIVCWYKSKCNFHHNFQWTTWKEHQLTLNQIFNCDETGLNYRILPDKTLVAFFEHSADGKMLSKEELQTMPAWGVSYCFKSHVHCREWHCSSLRIEGGHGETVEEHALWWTCQLKKEREYETSGPVHPRGRPLVLGQDVERTILLW